MDSVLSRIKNNHFWKFHGGIHPPEQKFLTNDKPIKPLNLPKQLTIPIQQHIGDAGELIVAKGDYVFKGQPLTCQNSPMSVPIHAPTSGTITNIALHMIAHPSGLSELCVFLTPDGKEQWRERKICSDFYQLERSEIINKIVNAGISGMGGAGFPTHIKVNNKPNIEYLIINAAECEPYITADDLLMREQSTTILDGIQILEHLLLPKNILIGIEDNKPEAIKILQQLTEPYPNIHVCVLPTKYPTGGEKQLIQALTGIEIISGSLPINHSIVMQNVATCFAIAQAVIDDIPLIKRVITISGQALEKPQNVWALIGTPVKDLLEQCHYQSQGNVRHIIMGGPMMGFTLPSDTIPVVKTTNCVLAPSNKEISLENKEVECIRCGQCADVCPSQLLPQEMQWSAKAKDHDRLMALNLFDCIDCGACAYVCPSQIPLVQYYRVAKAEIRQQQLQDIKAEKAKARFEARKARLERERIAREEKQRKASEARKAAMEAKNSDGSNAKSAVAAALARVKAKKAGKLDDNKPTETPTNENELNSDTTKSRAAAAIARAKAKKAQAAKELAANNTNEKPISEEETANTTAPAESKEAQVTKPAAEPKQSTNQAAIDKKAKIAATIAKAKAKKAKANQEQNAQQAPKSADKVTSEQQEATITSDKSKTLETNSTEVTATNPQTTNSSEESTEASANDSAEALKKKRIAAAVAKAKAKKLQGKQS